MHVANPFSRAARDLGSTPTLDSRNTRTQIQDASSKKVIPTMQLHILNNEVHVEAVQQRRLQQALLHEQRRIGRATNSTETTGVLNAIRMSVGSMLIAAGERIHRVPTRPSAAGTPTGAT